MVVKSEFAIEGDESVEELAEEDDAASVWAEATLVEDASDEDEDASAVSEADEVKSALPDTVSAILKFGGQRALVHECGGDSRAVRD